MHGMIQRCVPYVMGPEVGFLALSVKSELYDLGQEGAYSCLNTLCPKAGALGGGWWQ